MQIFFVGFSQNFTFTDLLVQKRPRSKDKSADELLNSIVRRFEINVRIR